MLSSVGKLSQLCFRLFFFHLANATHSYLSVCAKFDTLTWSASFSVSQPLGQAYCPSSAQTTTQRNLGQASLLRLSYQHPRPDHTELQEQALPPVLFLLQVPQNRPRPNHFVARPLRPSTSQCLQPAILQSFQDVESALLPPLNTEGLSEPHRCADLLLFFSVQLT